MLELYLRLVSIPLQWAQGALGVDFGLTGRMLYLIVVSLLLLGFAVAFLKSLWRRVRGLMRGRRLDEHADYEALIMSRMQPQQGQAPLPVPASGIEALLDQKQYDRAAEVYAEMGRPKEAAKWFKKAGLHRRAALELARAGKKMKAARILMREGDFENAGRLYEERGKLAKAADAYERAGRIADAARAYAAAGRIEQAARAYDEYFARARDAMEVQLPAAQECLKMLESRAGSSRIVGPARAELLKHLGKRFELAQWYELAGKLFLQAGDPVRAGEDFVQAGKFPEAAECMKAAGRVKEANQITGRYHETRGRFGEAALAYAAAGEYVRAAECYQKASEMVRAGECFEKAGDFYRSGLAFAQAGQHAAAIRVLQKVKESDPGFDQSRGLLGRCFYDMHDWAHAAATLENHLTGKRVESGNLYFYYLLALSYEQLGRLGESRDILYKIGTVDQNYKDIAQRLTLIASRISMQAANPASEGAPRADHRSSVEETQVMQVVENALDGRYHLERELGRGGMGVVYLARDTQLDRAVALKFLGSLVDGSEEFRQRFVREARAAARISHPNIISIYDISASAGKAYIAMEYVEGPSLSRYIAQKDKLTPREAVNIIGQACSALGAIHEAGIVHRDIKPDNILIGKGMLVKLTDFGLAKAEDARLTQAGTIMGTPSYMAPEQVLGKEADARSDLYALGLVLHEALTGRTVFREGDVLDRQLNEMPPPPGELVEGVPPALDEVVLACIAKKPEARYQSAKDLLGALRKAMA